MFLVVLVLHIFLCVMLVGLVMLQQGKGADAGAALGGGSNTLFGASGGNDLMVKVTTGVAVAFFITSIVLIKLYMDVSRTTVPGVAAAGTSLVEKLAAEGKAASAPVASASATAASSPAPTATK